MYEELLIVVKFRFFKDFLEACVDNKLVMNNGFVNCSCCILVKLFSAI